jgi:hypothetical protein
MADTQTPKLTLTREELIELTGYRRSSSMLKWLEANLKIKAPRRADGLPVVSRAQVEAALGGKPDEASRVTTPNWSR